MPRANRTYALLLLLAGGCAAAFLWFALAASPTLPAPAPVPVPSTEVAAPAAAGAASAAAAVPDPAPELDRRQVAATESGAREGQGVRGRVLDPMRQPVAGQHVYLLESSTDDQLPMLRAIQNGMPVLPAAATVTAADGSFALGIRTADGRRAYDVRVLADDHPDTTLNGVVLQQGEWYEAGDLVLRQGTVVRGRVTIAGTQLPVPLATVQLLGSGRFDDMIAISLPGREGGISTAADASGFYTLRKAPAEGLVTLAAVAPGFARLQKAQIELQGTAVEVDFELEQGLQLDGVVSDAAHNPVAGARLQVWSVRAPGATPYSAFSDQNGHFSVLGLREGPHRVTVDASGFQSQRTEVQLAAGNGWLQLQLDRRAAAKVRVLGRGGVVLDRYLLSVRRYFPEGGGQIGTVVQAADRSIRPDDLHNGFATIPGLDYGTVPAPGGAPVLFQYVFQVQAEGYAKTLSQPFSLTPGAAEPEIEMQLTSGGSFAGQVLDERGQPVVGAKVRTEPEGAAEDNLIYRMLSGMAPDKITRSNTETDATGWFRLGQLAFGDYQLRVAAAGYCDALVPGLQLLDASETRVPAVTLVRGTKVQGVAMLDGVPSGQIKIIATATGLEQDPARAALLRCETISGNDGRFALPHRLPPGHYELRAARQVGDQSNSDFFRQLQQLRSSAVPFTVLPGQDVAETAIKIATDH